MKQLKSHKDIDDIKVGDIFECSEEFGNFLLYGNSEKECHVGGDTLLTVLDFIMPKTQLLILEKEIINHGGNMFVTFSIKLIALGDSKIGWMNLTVLGEPAQ